MNAFAFALLFSLLQVAAPRGLRVDLVLNGAPLPPRVAGDALDEATEIWARYGVDILTARDAHHTRAGALTLSVTIADGPPVAPRTLGYIRFVGGVPTSSIVLYPTAVEDLVFDRHTQHEGQWPIFYSDRLLGRALGRALAHEIGHFLLRSREHSSEGFIMRANQTPDDLIARPRHDWRLSPKEVRRLDRTVVAFAPTQQ